MASGLQGSLYIIPSDYPFPFRTLVRLVTSGSLRDPRRRVARTSATEDASERRAKLLSFPLVAINISRDPRNDDAQFEMSSFVATAENTARNLLAVN